MKKIIPLAVSLLLALVGISQEIPTYSKFLGDSVLIEWADGIVIYQDTFYIVGVNFNATQSFQRVSCFKTTNRAVQILNKSYESSSSITSLGDPGSFSFTSDTNLITGGGAIFNGKSKGVLFKFDLNFDTIYVKEFFGSPDSSNYFLSVSELSDKSYQIAGVTSSFGAGAADAWFLNTDKNGKMNWQKTFGGGGRFRKFVSSIFEWLYRRLVLLGLQRGNF